MKQKLMLQLKLNKKGESTKNMQIWRMLPLFWEAWENPSQPRHWPEADVAWSWLQNPSVLQPLWASELQLILWALQRLSRVLPENLRNNCLIKVPLPSSIFSIAVAFSLAPTTGETQSTRGLVVNPTIPSSPTTPNHPLRQNFTISWKCVARQRK